MTLEAFRGEGTADAGPLTSTFRYRVAMASVALFATIAIGSVATGGTFGFTFAQRWNLFAPAPPSAVLDLYLIVRYDDGTVAAPYNLSDAVRREQVAHRFAPPQLVRVVTKVAQSIEHEGASPSERARLRRVLSATVNRDAHVTSVRAVLLRTAVRAFTDRRAHGPDRIFDSGWMPVQRDVAELNLR